jgi:pyridoxamine 5'-phosphate oxidase
MDSFHSLEEIYSRAWSKLQSAAKARHEPWHTAYVATVREEHPELRTMVLRGAELTQRVVWFHSDLRSPKCHDLKRSPLGAVLFHDAQDHFQLRLNGNFSLDSHSPESETAWKVLIPSSRRCYQGPFAPSTESPVLSSNIPEEPAPPHLGRENFTRLIFTITQMDCLILKAKGHIRARWQFHEAGFSATWLNP